MKFEIKKNFNEYTLEVWNANSYCNTNDYKAAITTWNQRFEYG